MELTTAWFLLIALLWTGYLAGTFAVWTQLAHGKGWTWVAVAVAAAALVGAVAATAAVREGTAFVLTTVVIVAAVVLLFGALFPNVMPSSTDAANSPTTANASSTPYTLAVMTWVAVILTPFVLLYEGWSYWVFRQRVSSSHVPAAVGLSPYGRRT